VAIPHSLALNRGCLCYGQVSMPLTADYFFLPGDPHSRVGALPPVVNRRSNRELRIFVRVF